MYSFSKDNIIQDTITTNKKKPNKDNKDKFIGVKNTYKKIKGKVLDTIEEIKARYNTWYLTTDFSEAGHKTAKFIKTTFYYMACIVLATLFFTVLISACAYVIIQFELCTALRPEWVDALIKSTDKTMLPLIFQDNQGHPFILFFIWIMFIKAVCQSLEALVFGLVFMKYSILGGIKLMNIRNIMPTILVAFMYMNMNNPAIYGLVFKLIGLLIIGFLIKCACLPDVPTEEGFGIFDADGNCLGKISKL